MTEMVRFFLIGIINTFFGYSIFSILIYLHLHYSMAVFIATMLGVLFNFKTLGNYVFKNSNNKLIGKFILVYIIIYLTNIAIIKLCLLLSMNIYLAGGFSVIIAAIASYLLNKKYVFCHQKEWIK